MKYRRLTVILFALVMIAVLCGCCLKHDYAPATCTEPETCTKCGKTRGEAAGHTEVIDEAVEPTCTEPGLTEGSSCSVCGEVFTAQEEIPATGHTEVIDEAVEASCTEPGLTEGSHCSVCGEILIAQEEIPATGHAEVIDEAVEATCTVPGLTEGSHCSVCGEILAAQEEIPATGHAEVIDEAVEPTCTVPGLTEGSHCSVCGEILAAQEEISATGHAEVIDEAVEPTCTVPGLTEGSHCSRCGEIFTAQEKIPATGHAEVIDEAVEATCTEPGLTEGLHCSVCEEVLTAQEVIPAKGHSWTAVGFSKPAVCRECGEAGEDELGYEFFLRALNPETDTFEAIEDRFSAALSGEERSFPETSKLITISGSGFGEDFSTNAILSKSRLTLLLNSDDESGILARLELKIPFMGTFTGYVTYDGEGRIGLMLPDFSEEYFLIDAAALAEDMPEETGFSVTMAESDSSAISEIMKLESPKDTLYRYEDIIFSIANDHNTTEENGRCYLEGLDETAECTILKVQPSSSDWQAMLRKLAETALEDDVLLQYVKAVAGRQYDTDYYNRYYYTRDEWIEESTDELFYILEDIRDYPEDYAEDLTGSFLEVAYEGTRIYALRICDCYEDGIEYESFGDVSDSRKDALLLSGYDYYETVAENTLRKNGRKTTGRFTIPGSDVLLSYVLTGSAETGKLEAIDARFSTPDVEVNALVNTSEEETDISLTLDEFDSTITACLNIARTDEAVILPAHTERLITTEEELYQAIDDLSVAVSEAFE